MSTPTADWSRLLSLAVHELRSPLNVAAGSIRLLAMGKAGEPTPEQRRLIDLADRSCERTSAVLLDLSDIAKIDAGLLSLSPRPCDLDQVIDQAVGAFEPPPGIPASIERRGRARDVMVSVDLVRFRRALGSCLTALARAAAGDAPIAVVSAAGPDDDDVSILVAPSPDVEGLTGRTWGPLDEWRGGLGLDLPLARRVLEGVGGRIESPTGEPRSNAIRIVLPILPPA